MRKYLIFLFALLLFGFTSLFGYPKRIVSLGPAITEQLYLLGIEDRLVGCTTYCKRPQEAENKEKVGTVIEINLEKLVSLKPDLVLATSLTDPRAVNKLKKLGIRVVCFSTSQSFAQLCEQFLELGKITGREAVAESLIEKAKQKVDSLKKKTNSLPKPKVLVQVGAKPLWVATQNSFINDYIELAGGENIGPSDGSGLYSREKVLNQNPDVIIIATMGIVGEEEKKTWQKYKSLNAVKRGKIYIFDSDKLCSPTPVSFAETLEEIAEILHPHEE